MRPTMVTVTERHRRLREPEDGSSASRQPGVGVGGRESPFAAGGQLRGVGQQGDGYWGTEGVGEENDSGSSQRRKWGKKVGPALPLAPDPVGEGFASSGGMVTLTPRFKPQLHHWLCDLEQVTSPL